ncbi:hypothetical protein TRV_02410 [Trichophyton verrucosum HKI 0517]|uniref:Uncharacterized protein n=1 Tax=Trichophyton verrucosum (strain HKI 0517) TaxID=663202 RepID=D4D5N7_TRIVH|nr:uncharacterized protein TRV_02410 [Trichophyton verrucosum HKI 0517]EFE42838.1 hypothetical protein TRV_02410 [Trichophyton verrucosum HKI 0517]
MLLSDDIGHALVNYKYLLKVLLSLSQDSSITIEARRVIKFFSSSRLLSLDTMNVNELEGDLRELYCNRSSFEVPNYTHISTSTAEWKLGPIFSEREVWDLNDPVYDAYITEAAAGMEVFNLKELTEAGSTCTPKLLDHGFYEQTRKNDPLPGGFMVFIVMERLPGRNLQNFNELPMFERDQVRLAFAKTIRRYIHYDPHRRNLMWDRESKKCYIIDLEDARHLDDDCPPKIFTPERDFLVWGIAGPEINTSLYGLDPMVPHDRKFIKNPSDEELEKMAQDAAGKPLCFAETT